MQPHRQGKDFTQDGVGKGDAGDFRDLGQSRNARLDCRRRDLLAAAADDVLDHGGQLSEAYIHGVNGIVEAVRLVRGTSLNQPKKPVEHALVTSGVGVPTGGAILGRMG